MIAGRAVHGYRAVVVLKITTAAVVYRSPEYANSRIALQKATEYAQRRFGPHFSFMEKTGELKIFVHKIYGPDPSQCGLL